MNFNSAVLHQNVNLSLIKAVKCTVLYLYLHIYVCDIVIHLIAGWFASKLLEEKLMGKILPRPLKKWVNTIALCSAPHLKHT